MDEWRHMWLFMKIQWQALHDDENSRDDATSSRTIHILAFHLNH